MKQFALLSLICLVLLTSCKKNQKVSEETQTPVAKHSVTTSSFGTLPDGKEVTRYTLRNANGVEVSVINYGGIITSLKTVDKQGQLADVVLGFDSLSSYLKGSPYFGALIGRYGNRIAKGKFTLDGTAYKLATNNNENHLHGGLKGFDKVFWNMEVLPDSASLKLTYTSADGEEGYPGNLTSEVVYTLTDADELKIDYHATTDKKTIVNLTQHTYFNLTGDANQDILNHQLMMDAPQLLPVDKTLIPTGELKSVTNTPFDFNTLTAIGSRIAQDDEQLKFGLGYDHCWVLNPSDGKTLRKVAELFEPTTGRVVEVSTTEPGLQFYSGNFLDGTLIGKGGIAYKHRSGLCLETQHYPNSPNQSSFPLVVLKPGEVYSSTTVYKFFVR
jgi:aldose 1-epimerase